MPNLLKKVTNFNSVDQENKIYHIFNATKMTKKKLKAEAVTLADKKMVKKIAQMKKINPKVEIMLSSGPKRL